MSMSTSLIKQATRSVAPVKLIARATFASTSSYRAEAVPTPTSSTGFTKKPTLSSCNPGTVLNGLSILKDKPDPVAKADDEYPAWLWNIIPTSKNAELATLPKSEGTFDYAAEKKKLRAINKARIKASNFIKGS